MVHSEKFKSRMVAKMVGPHAVSANALSGQVGICQPTLSRWLDEVKLEERNLIREIAKLGTSDEFYEVLRELREEKAAIQARIEAGQPEWSPASLEKPVRAAISQIESLWRSRRLRKRLTWRWRSC
jgi:hypothetical protein